MRVLAKKADSEYQHAIDMYRFYHEFRTKILHFYILLTAALFAAFYSRHFSAPEVKYVAPLMGVVGTGIFGFLEFRTIEMALVVESRLETLEKILNFKIISSVVEYTNKSLYRAQRTLLRIFYITLFVIWGYLLWRSPPIQSISNFVLAVVI